MGKEGKGCEGKERREGKEKKEGRKG